MKSKGQLGSSFQWIFVIIGGGVFLVFFFFVIKSCTDTGDDRIEAISLFSAGEKLKAAAWQGDTVQNISIEPSYVSCPTGSAVTLSTISGNTPVTLDDAPVFLPPELSGRLSMVTRQVVIGENTESPMVLGGSVYGLDENTHYFIIQDIAGQYRKVYDLLPRTKNIRLVFMDDVINPDSFKTPRSATTAVVVTPSTAVALEQVVLPDEPQRFLGVALDPVYTHGGGIVSFYTRNGDRLAKKASDIYVARQLGAGAAIAGSATNYKCANKAFTDRMRYTTLLYEARANELANTPEVNILCQAGLNAATNILLTINSQQSDEEYREVFSRDSWKLMNAQISLLDSACPVIA